MRKKSHQTNKEVKIKAKCDNAGQIRSQVSLQEK